MRGRRSPAQEGGRRGVRLVRLEPALRDDPEEREAGGRRTELLELDDRCRTALPRELAEGGGLLLRASGRSGGGAD